MSYSFAPRKPKDPQATLDYGLDLVKEGWLSDGETVTDQDVTVPDGSALAISSISEADGVIKFWASGGVAGADYLVTVEWTTSAGRTDQRTIQIPVRER